MLRIGYMGIPLSNSEEAAYEFVRKNGWIDHELVPLMNSAGVIDALTSGTIDYGVVAAYNSTAGKVQETEDALRGREDIVTVQTDAIDIHHCVFIKNEGVDIDTLASHIQAIMQTRRNLDRIYPGARRLEMEDTALAAKYLSEGRLPDSCAVICRKNAGERYLLKLAHENVEDAVDNKTSFLLLRKSG